MITRIRYIRLVTQVCSRTRVYNNVIFVTYWVIFMPERLRTVKTERKPPCGKVGRAMRSREEENWRSD